MKTSFILICMMIGFFGLSQELTQTVRGTITDKETLQPIIGAKVEIMNSDPYLAGVSNYDGKFRVENVPVGRQTVVITYIGYEPVVRQNIEINSKELVLVITMEESIFMSEEVVVSGEKKGETINKMATVSSRSFSVEESKRYAGSMNDVSRMAQNFAGVQGGNDGRNDIIVRGNSPTGILYRLEGIDIPNPNHFARFGTTGGPVSMLNNNVLSNSDFMTAAFPAEYGNAIAGVFDLKMRIGNNERHEFMFQFGFNGAELMAEGPLSKNKKASYMVSYRYNDLIIFNKLGLNIGTSALPTYQDLSFKLNFPHKKGVTAIFGIGGMSDISLLASQVDTNDLYSIDRSNTYFNSNVGVIGLNHKHRVGTTSYINFSSAFQSGYNKIINDTVDDNFENPFLTYTNESTISKWTNVLYYNKKFSAKHVVKTGLQHETYFLDLNDKFYSQPLNGYITLRDFKGTTMLFQPYAQYQYRPTPKLTLNAGIHYQLLTLANQNNLENAVANVSPC